MKKVLSFLSVLVLTILVSVFSVACGDKYKNMYLEVQYLEWTHTDENGVEHGKWKKIDVNPKSENYGLSFMLKDVYKNETNECYELRMRVLVKGTKKKVDQIYVACPEAELSNSTVKSGQVFTIRFSSTESPYLFITPSIKSDKAKVEFPIVMYSELDNIKANPDYFPAVVKGGDLSLNDLSDLIVYNGRDEIATNQLGVKYSIEGAGVKFIDGVYTIGSGTNTFSLDTRNNINKITVGTGFVEKAVTIKATSVYYDFIEREDKSGLSTEIDVKVVDNISKENINLNYKSEYDEESDSENNSKEIKSVALYKDSTKYAETNLVLSGVVTDEIAYKFGLDDSEEVCYDVDVLIFDSEIGSYVNIADYNYSHRGVQVIYVKKESSEKHKEYVIGVYEHSGLTENKLKFVVGFKNLKFTSKDYSLENSVLTYDLTIERADLPNAIYINGDSYRNGDSLAGVIYDKYEPGQKGLELNVNAVREVQKQTEIIMNITSNNDGKYDNDKYHKLGVYYFNDEPVDSTLRDLTNNIYLRFTEESNKTYPSQVNIEFKVLASPVEFEGEAVTNKDYITVNMNLTVSGSLDGVSTSKDIGNTEDNKLFGKGLPKKYIEANTNYITYVHLVSSGGFEVATETVRVSSEKYLVDLSKDGKTWVKSLKYSELENGKLYIKAEKDVQEKLVVTAENGAKFISTNIQFVETVGNNEPELTFDTTYIYNAKNKNDYTKTAYEEDYYNGKKGYYLAMQLGQDTDFTMTYLNGSKTAGIFYINAYNLAKSDVAVLGKNIATYAVDCVRVTNFSNGYSFNLEARNNNLTTIIKVEYKYYSGKVDSIQEVEDVVYLEIAVYAPVNNLTFTTVNADDKEVNNEIYYVNRNLTDKASVTINLTVNSTATKNIYFSSSDINSGINFYSHNNTGYIYNIFVTHDDNNLFVTTGKVDGKEYLDLTKSSYTLTLDKNILDEGEKEREIKISFIVKELCYEKDGALNGVYERTFTKIIKVIRHTPVEDIKITNTYDYNMYLSLLTEDDKTATFGAKVKNVNATYPNLEYELYEFDETNKDENYRGDRLFTDEELEVDINNTLHTVKLTAKEAGGMYVVRIIAPDSYSDDLGDYTISKYVIVTISDGSANSPYYLRKDTDVTKISSAPNKHFVLASNINLSMLEGPIASEFSGSLNGVIRVYDANTKTNVYSQYKFTDLNITNKLRTDDDNESSYNYGAFGKVTGTISNVVFERVAFTDLTLPNTDTNTVNIGVLAGINKGTIVNTSITLSTSNITITNNQHAKINIGALVGENRSQIKYYDQDNSSNKKYAYNIQSAIYYGNFTVNVNSISESTTINFGGLVGNNTENATLKANYFDYEESLFKEYLTASVDMKLNINSPEIEKITTKYNANIGGIVGNNDGTVNQVCVTGEVEASGNRIAIGGIAGLNANELTNSANYTTKVSGLAYTSGESAQREISGQYVGGAVGKLTGTITSVDVVYVDLSGTGFDTPRNASINGVFVVGGLVGYGTSGTVINGNVQSFFNNAIIKGFFKDNDITDTTYLGGLIGWNTGTNAEISFVTASLEARNADIVQTLTGGTINNAYFIGNVAIYEDGELQQLDVVSTNKFKITNTNNVYSLVFGYVYTPEDTNDEYEYGILRFSESVKGYYYPAGKTWITGTSAFDDGQITEVENAPILNLSSPWSNETEYKNYNYGLPVLTYNNEETMIALPDELYANVSEKEFDDKKEPVTVHINENGIFITDGVVNGNNTAIVFLSDRTYNLVSLNGETGLVDKLVDPTIASGQYYVKFNSGSDLCVLSGNTIKFTKTGRLELEFISLFNSDARDTVVIYVEKPVNAFEILSGGRVIESLNTQTNINKILEFNALFNNQDSKIDVQNLFLQFELFDATGNSLSTDVAKTNPLGNVKNRNDGYYSFDDLQLKIKDIETKNQTVKLKTSMYLDLANYVYRYINNNGTITAVTYEEVFGVSSVLIKEVEFDINIYQSATSLIVNTAEQSLPTSKDSSISFDIISSFVNTGIVNNKITFLEPSGNYLYTNITDTETFKVVISSNHEEDWLKTYNIDSLWKLFDYSCYYSTNEQENGYSYVFYFELKDEYKAITRDEKFVFTFVSSTNDSAKDSITVTYTPQAITNLRIENFKSGVVSSVTDGMVEYISNETHSSIIVPGKNGLIKIYVEPSFASVDMVEISSSEILVNGIPYKVRFQQMLYDTRLEHYVSYPGYTTENNTLKLQKNSYIKSDGSLEYTGVIYVRTILEKLIGVSQTFEISVNAYTYVRDEEGNYDKANPTIDETKIKSATKLLQTDYNPGVTLSVENLVKTQRPDETDVYLIEKNSTNAVVNAKIYGYHINQQPSVDFKWVNSNAGNPLDYVNYSIGSAVRQSDGSYNVPVYITTKNLSSPVQMSMSLSLISEGTINTSESKEILLYPVDYIPTGVYLKDSGNNYATISVNSSMYFDFVWLSNNQELNSNDINAGIFESDEITNTELDYLYTSSYNHLGVLERNYLNLGEFTTYKITADSNAKRYSITALGEGSIDVTFYIRYSYIFENGEFKIKFFSDRRGNQGDYSISYNFTIRFTVATTEATATPIWTAEQFRTKITAAGNYILMDNITLKDWAPMDATFASLDGNGKVIKITNFSVPSSQTVTAGLFNTISPNTILKNVIVDIGSCETTIMLSDENTITGDTNFGFIAGVNQGIIYNSEVISNTSTERTITIKTSSTKSNVGLLVGNNQGVITNSRVGTPYYESITVDENGSTTSQVGKTSVFTVKTSGIVAGFVAVNSGIISSSYFNNANIINTHIVGNDDVNMTAGFVATNLSSGKIYSSYAKGKGITAENIRGDMTGVSNTGAGSAAGFVFVNEGLIENSYTNLLVESSSFGVSGFVYNNKTTGVIKQSYSASKVNSNSDLTTLAVKLPFVGVDILNNLQSYGKLENCYYLQLQGDTYDTKFLFKADMDMPISLNETNFAVSESLVNFAFVEGNYSQNVQGVWTYFATLDKNDQDTYKLGKTYLPELTSANQIARSIRYVVEKEGEDGNPEHVLMYANGYNQGTTKNPYIIRDYNEYNSVFNYNKEDKRYNGFTGNARLINDIDFTSTEEDTVTINTTLGFTLGDKNNQTLTVFDGNGLTISGVDTKNNEVLEQNSLGLFNDVVYSIIKNIKIEFIAMNYTSTRAMYSGGLAGTIKDSHIIGVDLKGQGTTISAFNFAGGLAGIITGDSGIYNVTSNLSVKVGKENLFKYYQYISKDKFESTYSKLGYNFTSIDTDGDGDIDNNDRYMQYMNQLSYAGGLAGVIDYNTKGKYASSYNLNKVTIGENTNVSVVADIAGFAVGYIGRGVSANRVKAVINNGSYVEGAYIAGGLAGEHYGKIRYSQVSYLDNTSYDKAFASYVIDETVSSINKSSTTYGTLSFVRSNTLVENCKNIAGGFIGVNYGGYVDNSYTKANITANASYIGGFIGVNFGGTLNSVYAQNYIDLATLQNVENSEDKTEKVGGLIAVNTKIDSIDNLSNVYKLNGYNDDSQLKADTIVISTFFDKNDFIAHYENIIKEMELAEDKQVAVNVAFDYLIAESVEEGVRSSQGVNDDSLYVYYLNHGEDSSATEKGNANDYIYYSDYISANIEHIEGYDAMTAEQKLAADKEKADKIEIWNKLISVNKNISAVAEDIRHLYDLDYDKQEDTFIDLFLSFDMTMWDKDNTKYFPTLKDNPAINFYEINDESDLLLMILYPDANFVLNGDIQISNAKENYVLDIEFTGMLIGRADANGNNPTIRGIKLYTNVERTDNSAGFFRQTGNRDGNGAIITNVNFEYNYFVACNTSIADKNIGTVGLLSPVDYGSEISGVMITCKNTDATISYSDRGIDKSSVKNCAIVTDPNLGSTITTFGGLIGESYGSNIINCDTYIDACIKSYVGEGTVTASNIGGLVGHSTVMNTNNKTIIKNSDYDGELYLTNSDNVGGLVGYANNTSITAGSTNLTVTNKNESSYYMGGVIGNQEESYVEDTMATLTIKDSYSYDIDMKNVGHYIGGISGHVKNESSTADVGVIGALSVINIELSENVGTLVVAGVYGLAEGYAKIKDSVTWTYGSISGADSTRFGGLVGAVTGALIHIDNCLAYIEGENEAVGLSVSATDNLKLGGLIASVEKYDAVVSIKNSSSSGAIWPTNTTTSSTTIDISAGGLIGEWIDVNGSLVELDKEIEKPTESTEPEINTIEEPEIPAEKEILYKTNITNCYTTLMFETSSFKAGKSEKYHVSAFIGYIPSSNGKIETSKLYYSSDFTLCLEEEDVFTDAPVDLVAQAILLSYQKDVFFTDGWEIVGGGLPYRTSLSTKLSKINNGNESIYSRYTNEYGYSLNPKRITGEHINADSIESEHYKYYFVYNKTANKQKFKVSGDFSGVILGGGSKVEYERATVTETLELLQHSVLSNLKVTIREEMVKEIIEDGSTSKEFSFVSVNDGTIFNVYLDYFYKPVDNEPAYEITSGGGIVNINNGTMLYCFNTGNIEEVITRKFGGIATTNNGYIAHSGFVGTLTGSTSTAGFCHTNNGTIYNCYSAGVVDANDKKLEKKVNTFIILNTGTLENCYYDMYANAQFDDIVMDEITVLKPIDTSSLQGTTHAGLKGTWNSYVMTSKLKEESPGAYVNDYQMSYNYGYPIYTLNQKWIFNGQIDDFVFKGLETGDGSSADPFLLNNLGTVNQINTLTTTSGYSFMLVNDIDANKNNQNASKDTGIMENWEGVNAFAGEFATGVRGYVINDNVYTNNDTVRIINNLTGKSGLFNTILAGANISMIAFNHIYNISNTGGSAGALANSVNLQYEENGVNSDEYVAKDVYIAGIFLNALQTHTSLMQISAQNVGGLIGSVSGNGTLSLEYINTYQISDMELDIRGVETATKTAHFNLFSTTSASNLGSLIGQVSGTATVDISGVAFSMASMIGFAVNNNNEIIYNNASSVGGLIGGITADSSNSEICPTVNISSMIVYSAGNGNGQIVGTNNVGGIIGSNGGKVTLTLKDEAGLTLALGNESVTSLNVGGLIGAMNAGSFVIDSPSDVPIQVTKIYALNNGGGLVGKMTGGTFNLSKSSSIKIDEITANGPSGNAGGIAGSMTGGQLLSQTETPTKIEVAKLVTTQGSAGGATGYFGSVEKDGNYTFGTIAGFEIILSGEEYECKNFGGVSGEADGGIFGSKDFAINVSGDVTLKTSTMAGAIIGLINAKSDKDSIFQLQNITSKLNIVVERGNSETGLGGIAGSVNIAAGADATWIEFGTVTLEGNKFEAKNNFRNVGGLFGQLSDVYFTCKENSQISISGLTIAGTQNVGGFAGYYHSENAIAVNSQIESFLNGASVGTIQIAEVEKPETDAFNFGGLFGLYEASQLGYYLTNVEEEQTELKAFVNKNNLFNSLAPEGNYKAYSLAGNVVDDVKYNESIYNVGGIAGQFITDSTSASLLGMNEASVGSGYEDGDSHKYSELTDVEFQNPELKEKILNITSVGGLVGNITYEKGTSAVADEPAVSVTDPMVTIKDAKNSGVIKGYQFVGGLIGSVTGTGLQATSANIGGAVYGHSYLGGVIGYIDSPLDWGSAATTASTEPDTRAGSATTEPSTMEGVTLDGLKLSGYSYIGGIAGEVVANDKGSRIKSFDADGVTINGLINIGGVVGYVKSSQHSVKLSGHNGDYEFAITGNTNVGGVAGYAVGQNAENKIQVSGFSNFNVDITLLDYEIGPNTTIDEEENVYYKPTSVGGLIGYADNVDIGSSVTGKINTNDELSKESLSGVNNYLVDKGHEAYRTGSWDEDENKYISGDIEFDYRSYEATETGVGGLVGTGIRLLGISGRSTVNIYAPNGSNVGGIAGYLTLAEPTLNLDDYDSTETDDIYIVGGIGVGALFGGLASSNTIQVRNDLSREHKTYLQQTEDGKHTYGMYVGGLIGKSTSIDGAKIGDKGNIVINNTDGYGFGALIGWLDGNLENGDSFYGVEFSDSKNYNYGGLVGCLNVKVENFDAVNVLEQKVLGNHGFTFTIDEINTRYYYNSTIGERDSAYTTKQFLEVDKENKILYLMNYLISNTLTTISSSNYVTSYNPVRYALGLDGTEVKTYGWAKEYTMFRKLNYVYNVDMETVSKQPIYNAEFVVEVGHEDRDSSQPIEYTIYDNGSGPVLYSKLGIAEYLDYYKDSDTNKIGNTKDSAIKLMKKILDSYLLDFDASEVYEEFNPRFLVRPNSSYSPPIGTYKYYCCSKPENIYPITKQAYSQFVAFTSANIVNSLLIEFNSVTKASETFNNYKDNYTTVDDNLDYYLFETERYGVFRYSTPFADFSYDEGVTGRTSPCESGCLFDVVGTIANRQPEELRDTHKFLWLIDSWMKDDVYKLAGTNRELNANYEDIVKYFVNNVYEKFALDGTKGLGLYGFIGDMLYRDGVVNSSISDKTIRLRTKYKRGGTDYTDTMLYYYYSTTEPKDFDTAATEITKDVAIAYPKYTDYVPQEGDLIPKYKRVGDEYYIVSYALDQTGLSDNFDGDLSEEDKDKPCFYLDKNDNWYVPKGLVDDNYIQLGLSRDRIYEARTIKADLGFVYDPEYTTEGIEGYDYVNIPVKDLNWKFLSGYTPEYDEYDSDFLNNYAIPLTQEVIHDEDEMGSYHYSKWHISYQHETPSGYLVPIDLTNTENNYMNIDTNADNINSGDKDEVDRDDSSKVIILNSEGNCTISETGVFTSDSVWNLVDTLLTRLDTGMHAQVKNNIDNSIAFKYSGKRNMDIASGSKDLPEDAEKKGYVVKEVIYAYYRNTGTAWFDESELTSNNSRTAVYETLDQNTELNLYHKDAGGNFVRITKKLSDLTTTNAGNYYYGNTSAKTFESLYKMTDYGWAIKRFGYYVKREDRKYSDPNTGEEKTEIEYILYRSKLTPEGDFVENKSAIEYGEDKLYTRYKYKDDIVEKLKAYVVPGSDKLKDDYKLAEIAMYAFNTYTGAGEERTQRTGFKCAGIEKNGFYYDKDYVPDFNVDVLGKDYTIISADSVPDLCYRIVPGVYAGNLVGYVGDSNSGYIHRVSVTGSVLYDTYTIIPVFNHVGLVSNNLEIVDYDGLNRPNKWKIYTNTVYTAQALKDAGLEVNSLIYLKAND